MRPLSTPGDAHQSSLHADLNLNEVLEVIRNADPATFQEFFANDRLSGGHARQALAAASNSLTPASTTSSSSNAVRPKADLARAKKQAFVRILEQPASKGLRFRYECEGRSAGSIPGVRSTNDSKTFPTIQVMGYKGRAVVVVSCVTVDAPYRPHPHNLVGKEGCKKGVCTLEMDPESMICSFPSLGIQCVKKKEIEASLALREQIRVDPFQTGFAHKDCPQSIDLNCVRLCFQVFLEGNEPGAFTFALKPVVTDPIYDKKAKNDLMICRITECSASAAGGKELLLFCEKVTKDDVQVRFYEENDRGQVVWEGFGDFQPSDVHKQYGICFRTPRYHNLEIEENVRVNIQLRRPSDGAVSDPRPFEILPLDGGRSFWASKRMKTNHFVFNNILAASRATATAEESVRRKVPQGAGFMMVSIPSASQTLLSPSSSLPSQETSSPMTEVSSSMEGPASLLPREATMNLRPLSQASLFSDSSTASNCTRATVKSVNEILSLADTVDDNDSEAKIFVELDSVRIPSEPSDDVSIANLVKLPSSGQETASQPVRSPNVEDTTMCTSPSDQMDIDINALYDDVMHCVYDDVDTKYDVMDFAKADDEPPVPPQRKRVVEVGGKPAPPTPSEDFPEEDDSEKPLPSTPSKVPALLTKFTVSGGAKQKDKKKKDKAEREAEKQKQKESRKQNEADKKKDKKKGNEDSGVISPRTSLFHRLFSRSKSIDEGVLSPASDGDAPEVPAHLSSSMDGNGNLNSPSSVISIDENADLADLQQLLVDSGTLDNMVNEFAKEFCSTNEDDELNCNGISTSDCPDNTTNNNANNILDSPSQVK